MGGLQFLLLINYNSMVHKKILLLLCFCSHQVLAADCGSVSGTTTISTNCTSLNIIGDDSNVTINSGVTINTTKSVAVKTPNATNATITNNGTITVPNNDALRNTSPGHISNLTNNGSIAAGVNNGVKNGGVLDILTNTGTISAGADVAIRNLGGSARRMGTLTNSGTISAGDDFGIRNDGILETIMNSGTISADDDNGFWTKGTITTLTNTASGTISAGDDNAIKVFAGSEVETITNAGTISAGRDFGIRNDRSTSLASKITTLTNSGTISAANESGIWNDGEIVTLTNTGTIKAINGDYGIKNVDTGEIGLLNNSGTISAGNNYGIYNDGGAEITSLRNTGTISAAGNGISIFNDDDSIIGTLSNLQGASSSALTYDKKLPTYYNVIVGSATNFGMVTFSNLSGVTRFGVDSSSILADGVTYSSVISGLSLDDIASGTSGTHTNPSACTKVHGASITFSSNCAEIDISGDSSDITINSGVTISGVGDYDWTLNNSSGTTWDLASTAQLDDAVNTGTNTSLNNLGTITALATGANGILNQGTFTTLINRGLVTSDSAFGISNTGTITTLNNLQGASSSALTYDGKLPTNYNVIVNSTSDYGKTVFSSVSGKTTFGVDSTSTLESDTTYSSVISGLTNSDIAAGTSGSQVSGSIRKEWTLTNSSGNLWDLVVAPDQDITEDTITSVTTGVKPNVITGINNLTSVTEVNFANMNTYDCDLFDKNNKCLSLGGRYTSINTPKTETNSAVLVGGYKLSDTLRVGAFYHSNLSHKTPASFTLSDKTPMTGALLVWNQNPNHLGYQLKLANAYQQKNATLTREVVGSSEEGKGETVIEAKSYVAELQYGYQYGDNTVLRPYFAARSAVIKQDAYTETGISSPLTFNEIKDKSTTVLLGLKFNTNLTHKLSLKGSVGVEHDIEHSIDKLAPTGISGLSTVSLTESFNETRPVVSLGLDYALKSNHRLSGVLQYQELPYQSKTESNAYLYYTIGF